MKHNLVNVQQAALALKRQAKKELDNVDLSALRAQIHEEAAIDALERIISLLPSAKRFLELRQLRDEARQMLKEIAGDRTSLSDELKENRSAANELIRDTEEELKRLFDPTFLRAITEAVQVLTNRARGMPYVNARVQHEPLPTSPADAPASPEAIERARDARDQMNALLGVMAGPVDQWPASVVDAALAAQQSGAEVDEAAEDVG